MNTDLYKTFSANRCWYYILRTQRQNDLITRCLYGRPLTATMEHELSHQVDEVKRIGLYLNTLNLTNGTIHFAAFKKKRHDYVPMVFYVNGKRCWSVYEEDSFLYVDYVYYEDSDKPIAAFKLEQGEDDLFHHWRTECMIEAGKLC